MVGGKGKGKGDVISLVVEEMRERCSAVDADAAVEAWLRGDVSEPNRKRVFEALVAAEARLRASRLVVPQECESGEVAS